MLFPAAIAMIVTAIWFTRYKRAIKRAYYTNKELVNNPVNIIDFYEDHLICKKEKSISECQYKNFYRIIETKTHFYLMTSSNTGIIIIKQNCSPELIVFLQDLKEKNKRRRNG